MVSSRLQFTGRYDPQLIKVHYTQVLIKRRKRGRGGVDSWEVVRARGHLDEVQELKSGEAAQALAQGRPSKDSMQLVLTEGAVLGGGAFSRVSIVTGTFECL